MPADQLNNFGQAAFVRPDPPSCDCTASIPPESITVTFGTVPSGRCRQAGDVARIDQDTRKPGVVRLVRHGRRHVPLWLLPRMRPGPARWTWVELRNRADHRPCPRTEIGVSMDANRQTGRTTRMLEHAKQLAAQGKAVYVIAANKQHADQLAVALGGERMGVDIGDGIKVETPESCSNFDWHTMSLRGAHPNCVVLVDHFAIERRFSRILEALHAYDLPASALPSG